MPARGTILNTEELPEGVIGTLNSATTISEVATALGAISNTTNLTLDGGTPSESRLYLDQFTSNGSPKDVLIYLPPGYEDNSDDYPIVVWLHGDGGKGTATYTTGVSLSGSGTGPYTANFVNTTTVEVAAGSVEIYDNGVLVAIGKTDGTLLEVGGSGVTGTIAHKSTNGAVSVTFSSTPTGPVTMNYAKSVIFETSLPDILNDGDEPPGIIIVCPQINTTDFDPEDDWDDLLTFADSEFRIDTNRQYISGFSRGGRGARIIWQARYTEIAALYTATMDFTNLNTDDWAALYANKGFWVHMGTADSSGLGPNGMLSLTNNSTTTAVDVPPICTPYWNIDHTSFIWTTSTFSRSERTDTTGTADHDWVRWIKKFSLDDEQRATLFTEHAEYTNDIVDYRAAYIQVNNLASGAPKTSLLSRLATVRTAANKSGVRYIVDAGATTVSLILPETSGTNVNNLTNFNASQSISNLVGEDKSASTIGFAVNTEMATAPTTRVAPLGNRGIKKYHGYSSEDICGDGARVLNGVSGEIEFNNLPAGTYDVRVYYGNGSSNFSLESSIIASIGGDGKADYAELNGYRFFEWTGLSPDGGNDIKISTSNSGGTFSHITSIELLKY